MKKKLFGRKAEENKRMKDLAEESILYDGIRINTCQTYRKSL